MIEGILKKFEEMGIDTEKKTFEFVQKLVDTYIPNTAQVPTPSNPVMLQRKKRKTRKRRSKRKSKRKSRR